MIALSVNLNKIALLRNSRGGKSPELLLYAQQALQGGADGITVHPRPDGRHIRPSDISDLKNFLQEYPSAEFNMEGNPFGTNYRDYPGFLPLIEKYRPHQCTLVPDSDTQLTSDHGFDLGRDATRLKPVIERVKSLGVRVSLFMDPDLEQISRAADIGADRIELYTGPFAEAFANPTPGNDPTRLFEQHCRASEHAHRLGLGVNAGHDLDQQNLQQYRHLPYLLEVSIGHALIADSLQNGFTATISAYKALLQEK